MDFLEEVVFELSGRFADSSGESVKCGGRVVSWVPYLEHSPWPEMIPASLGPNIYCWLRGCLGSLHTPLGGVLGRGSCPNRPLPSPFLTREPSGLGESRHRGSQGL